MMLMTGATLSVSRAILIFYWKLYNKIEYMNAYINIFPSFLYPIVQVYVSLVPLYFSLSLSLFFRALSLSLNTL